MKNLLSFSFCLCVCWSLGAQCTVNRWCLSFQNSAITNGGTQFEFDIVMSSNLNFGLGSSNLQFRYNNNALAAPVIVSTPIAPPLYQTSSITTPFIPSLNSKVGSFNLELNTVETGYTIPATGVIICRLRFNIINSNLTSGLVWYYNGGTAQTVVFDDDETLQLCSVTTDMNCLVSLNVPLSEVLPLHLTRFEAQPLQNTIALLWASQQETNFKGYSLERSVNGSSDFKEITFVPGKGGQGTSSYAYDDQQVSANLQYYYRLKMVDLDGKFQYSPIRTARLSGAGKTIDLYPNPVQDKLYILWNEVVPVTTRIYNLEGQLVQEFTNKSAFDFIDVASLPTGTYLLVVQTEQGKSLGYKFVKGK